MLVLTGFIFVTCNASQITPYYFMSMLTVVSTRTYDRDIVKPLSTRHLLITFVPADIH